LNHHQRQIYFLWIVFFVNSLRIKKISKLSIADGYDYGRIERLPEMQSLEGVKKHLKCWWFALWFQSVVFQYIYKYLRAFGFRQPNERFLTRGTIFSLLHSGTENGIHQTSPYSGSRIYAIQRIYIHSLKLKKKTLPQVTHFCWANMIRYRTDKCVTWVLVYGYGFHTGIVGNSPDWVYFSTIDQ
jgi:hypothetical protein